MRLRDDGTVCNRTELLLIVGRKPVRRIALEGENVKKLAMALLFSTGVALGQQAPAAADAHAAGVDQRGDHAMGFSHEKTAHHFTLLADGGSIEVVANDSADAESREEVQNHLGHIVTMFRNNDFDIPMLIHDRVPPGVPVMKQKRQAIDYSYAPTDRGGLVRIKTADPEALSAIHEFLLFQIRDHRTGDPESVKKP